jgi:hypothetical protein
MTAGFSNLETAERLKNRLFTGKNGRTDLLPFSI